MAYSSLDPVTGSPVFLDSDAPDPAVNPSQVAAYAGQVGTRLIGTTAERTAYSYAREGLAWFDTTLNQGFVHDGTGWQLAFEFDTEQISATTEFGSGWSNYTASGWSGVKYRRLNGWVEVNGAAQKTSWGTDDTILTLPAGFRPAVKTVGSQCNVLADGRVQVGSGTGAVAFSAQFPAA